LRTLQADKEPKIALLVDEEEGRRSETAEANIMSNRFLFDVQKPDSSITEGRNNIGLLEGCSAKRGREYAQVSRQREDGGRKSRRGLKSG
jgi:hypothetical protein